MTRFFDFRHFSSRQPRLPRFQHDRQKRSEIVIFDGGAEAVDALRHYEETLDALGDAMREIEVDLSTIGDPPEVPQPDLSPIDDDAVLVRSDMSLDAHVRRLLARKQYGQDAAVIRGAA